MLANAPSLDPKNLQPPNTGGTVVTGQKTSSNQQAENAQTTHTTIANQNQTLAAQDSNIRTSNTITTKPESSSDTTTLDDPQSSAGLMDWLSHNKKTVVKHANYLQALLNGLSFITKFPILKPLKKVGDQLGELGTKFFFLVNGAINAFQQFQFKNFTGFLGYMVYVANGLFVPQEKMMMMNGLGVGLTQWVNMASNALKDSGHKGTYLGFADHFKKLFTGTATIIKESWRNPIKAAMNGKPILGLTGAFMALYGVAHWAVTGNVKVGKFFRSLLGGAALDGEQILGHQLKHKRNNYAKSGITYLVGTAFDYIREFVPSLNDYFRPLSFLFDGFGRYYQGVSEQNNEQSDAHLSKEEIANIEKKHNSPDKPSYASMFKELISTWFKSKPTTQSANIIDNARHQGELVSAAA